MSKKTLVAFLAMFAAFAAFAADGAASKADAASTSVTKQSVEAKEVKPAVKTEAKKESAEAARPAEKKEAAKPAEKKEASEKKETEIGASDLSIGDVTAVLSGMLPMVGGDSGLFSKDDAVKAFQDLLKLYRESSPEEKQQVVLAVSLMQGVISTLSISSGMLLQQMEPEDREQVVESASSTVKILSEAQKEVTAKMTDDEKKVFGGLFQSLQNFCESFLKAAKK